MSDYAVALINAAISIIVAAIVGWVSAKQSYNKGIRKTIYEERQKLYIETFELLEQLQHTPYIMFNTEKFVQPFRKIKARANLYASREVLDILKPFNDKIVDIRDRYIEAYESEAALKELEGRKLIAEESGDTTTEQVEWEFQQEADAFMERNVIHQDEIDEVLRKLAFQIRAELKTE